MVTTILTVAGILTAITAISAFLCKLYKAIKKIDKRIETVDGLKEEHFFVVKTLLAVCDGLGQLGANGPVTKAKEELQEYVIRH